ncbi:hypothetical protein [Bacillus wiedmannii]|uniref:hypothetical protein n=1 Tax=Bacillus wiedmannii TaxID=1890302 RepID=UPI000BF027C8|nr:hypothetical protein [Bacillus wiedmannii]PEM30158.1 hypothetical protein CN598_12585 [Bacillus wiedmannii]
MAKTKQQFPWLNKQETKTIPVEGVRVTYKTLSFGEQRKAQSEALVVGPNGKPKLDFGLIGVLQTVAAIVEWDFTDEDGNKLPISLHTFDEVLDPEFGGKIIQAVSEQVTTDVDIEKKKK